MLLPIVLVLGTPVPGTTMESVPEVKMEAPAPDIKTEALGAPAPATKMEALLNEIVPAMVMFKLGTDDGTDSGKDSGKAASIRTARSATAARRLQTLCEETCEFASDGECDDPLPAAPGLHDGLPICALGSDCTDCGERGNPSSGGGLPTWVCLLLAFILANIITYLCCRVVLIPIPLL